MMKTLDKKQHGAARPASRDHRAGSRSGRPPVLSNRDKQLFAFASDRAGLIRTMDARRAKKIIAEKLALVAELLGLELSEALARKLGDFIQAHFDYFHPDELTYAVELAYLGVLGLEEAALGAHLLELAGLTKVLRAYLAYRTERVNRIKGWVDHDLARRTIIERRILWAENMLQLIRYLYARYLRDGGLEYTYAESGLTYETLYDYLEYLGFLRMSAERRAALYREAWLEALPEVIKEERRAPVYWAAYTGYENRILNIKAERLMRCRAILTVFLRWEQDGKTADEIYALFSRNFCAIDPASYAQMAALPPPPVY